MTARKPKPLRWHSAAYDDLCEIVDYIAADSPVNADRFAKAVFARVELLTESPHLGSVCPHFRKARQLIHGNYVIYYSVHRTEIVIRAVVHGARLFRSYWLRREE